LMAEHIPRRTRAEIIARQNAEAAKILHSRHPPHSHLSPVYGSGMSYLEFAIAALLGFVLPFFMLWIVSLGSAGIYLQFQLDYCIAAALIACACYLNLGRAHAPSGAVAAIFTFALVSALGIWVPLAGILMIIVSYFLLAHNGWLEG